jgi:hypothetical protein
MRTGMYLYIPVRTFNKTSCFLTHPERVRRDKIKAVQLLCMGYNVTKLNFKTTQVKLIDGTYWYILVHTDTYKYRQSGFLPTLHVRCRIKNVRCRIQHRIRYRTYDWQDPVFWHTISYVGRTISYTIWYTIYAWTEVV